MLRCSETLSLYSNITLGSYVEAVDRARGAGDVGLVNEELSLGCVRPANAGEVRSYSQQLLSGISTIRPLSPIARSICRNSVYDSEETRRRMTRPPHCESSSPRCAAARESGRGCQSGREVSVEPARKPGPSKGTKARTPTALRSGNGWSRERGANKGTGYASNQDQIQFRGS